MNPDRMQLKLELDALYAQANVYANEAAKALLADKLDEPTLSVALKWAQQWQAVQDDIELLRNDGAK